MAKKQKERKVDYTQKEMIDMTGLTRKQFGDALKKVCDMYGFKIIDFKVDEFNKDSGFYFPPETAELLALLIRNLENHPLSRSNVDKTKITATEISKYNKKVLEDIDYRLVEVFRKMIYCRPSHLVSQKIADWSIPLVSELTYFLVNLITLKEEDVGAALSLFTKKLDEMNYCLFRGSYIIKEIYKNNNAYMMEYMNEEIEDEYKQLNDRLNIQNSPIDNIIADMIRWEMIDAHRLRKEGFPDLKELIDEENQLRMLIGQKIIITNKEGKKLFEEIENPTDEELREAYYAFRIQSGVDNAIYKNNEYIMKHYREQTQKWKSIREKIKEGIFAEPHERSLTEKKEILRNNILIAERDIEEYKQLLGELEQQNEEDEKDTFLEEMQQSYVNHCELIDEEYEDLRNIVDRFIGQVLSKFMS